MEIRLDDLSGPEIRRLLDEHLTYMAQLSPPESVHALDIDALGKPDITFWTVWSGVELLGCGALKGVARTMLTHIIEEASKRCYARLSLETGSMAAFEPAQRLYERFGFTFCPPFADYVADPSSIFMTRPL
jgi:putative acetyltransferase